jgi:CHAT domain-containing protein/tetratricopeptide (TPR) repeat protein
MRARWLGLCLCLGWAGAAAGHPTPQATPPADPSADQLAADLLSAPDEAAREGLLAGRPDVPKDDLCSALLERGKAFYKAGDTAAALAAFEETERVAESAGLEPRLADALYRIGVTREERGELDLATEPIDRAEAIDLKLGDEARLARIWNHRGLHARRLARFDEAESYFRRSLQAFGANGESDAVSAVLGNLGLVCMNRGDYACAMDAEQRALSVDPRNSYAIHNIASIHENQGDEALALDGYLRAAALDHEDGDAVHEATVLVEAGRMRAHLGREKEALGSFAKARAILEEAKTPDELGELEFALGEVNLKAGRAPEAVRHFEAAVALQESVDQMHLTDTLVYLSHAQLDARRPAAALASAQRSLDILRKYDSFGGMSHAWLAIGEAQEALGEPAQARAAYASAITAIETWRERLAGEETEHQRFFEGWLKPYHRLVAFATAAGRFDEAFELAERARARVLVDVLQHGRRIGMRLLTPAEREREAAAELEVRTLQAKSDAAGDAAAAEMRTRIEAARRELRATRIALFNAHAELRLARGEAEIVAPSALAPLLGDDGAAVAFTVTDDATYVFVLTPAGASGAATRPGVGLRVVRLETGAKAWRRRVEAFRGRLAQRDLDVASEARALFAALLGPVRREIAGRRRLYVVPDGPLWELPFAALQPTPGRFLIEDSALAIAPSLTALAAWHERPARPRPSGGYEALVVGEAEFGAGRARLPAAELQARGVAALYGTASRILVGREATEARVKAEAGRARVLHFATHGAFEPASPLYSALLLAPEPEGSPENGRLEAREILDLELTADLAVLSACETARGRIGAGEGVIGLSWALSVAGVRNTVVSLWNVDAASTAGLMIAFHRRAQAGVAYPEALRRGMLRLLRDPKTRHPFYWAPFVLVGDGRPAQGTPQALPE